VDLSWRARAEGLSTRVAPGALVHHYTVTRKPSVRRDLSVRRSAALLGAKYGDEKFAQARHAEYVALGGDLPLPAMERPARALARMADFQHLFEFAEGRW
jgi:GT2 family glycosyltransferase